MRLLVLALLGTAACSGQIAGGGDPGPLSCDLGIPQAGAARIRRLTPRQYQNTVRDLFADPTITVSLLPDEEELPSALAIEKFDDAANQLGRLGGGQLDALPACAQHDAGCAAAFVDAFATRAFRRPLSDDERAWLLDAFAAASAKYTFDDGITIMTQMILLSPQFLYLAPVGTPAEGAAPGLRQLDDYELAARLSYFLWNTMPDDELFDAARGGRLTAADGAGLREQAERMLAADQARDMADDFLDEWFQLDGGTVHFGLDEAPKDATLYPAMDADMRGYMRREIDALIEKVLFDGGTVGDLFTDTSAYVNGPLAALYGVADGPTTADQWNWVELDPTQRAGLLTRAAFAATYSTARVQAPIRRGTFVLRRILCYDQPPPPPDVDNRPIEGAGDGGPTTVRQDTELRTQGGTCAGCHSLIDPIGFTFEHYDAIGTFRTTEVESGLPIDASGVLAQSGNADGPVADAIGLSKAIAKSDVATDCLSRRWFEQALRRAPDVKDQCTFESITEATGNSGNLRDILLAIITSDAFLNVNPGAE